MSKKKVEFIIANGNIGDKNTLRGKYFSNKSNRKELYYDSSYELRAFKILESGPNIRLLDRCNFYIEYIFNNKRRRYIPDIFVEYIDGTKSIIEIKPKYKLKDELTQAKILAGSDYCFNNNLNFYVWTEKDLFANSSDYTNFLKSLKTS